MKYNEKYEGFVNGFVTDVNSRIDQEIDNRAFVKKGTYREIFDLAPMYSIFEKKNVLQKKRHADFLFDYDPRSNYVKLGINAVPYTDVAKKVLKNVESSKSYLKNSVDKFGIKENLEEALTNIRWGRAGIHLSEINDELKESVAL